MFWLWIQSAIIGLMALAISFSIALCVAMFVMWDFTLYGLGMLARDCRIAMLPVPIVFSLFCSTSFYRSKKAASSHQRP